MILHEASKVVKFCISGGIGTFTDFVLYVLLSSQLDITFSKCCSMLVSCVISFFLNKSWTFQVKGKADTKQVIRYVVSQILNICVNVSSNTGVYRIFHKKILAYLVATFAGMTVNFLLQRFFVFKKTKGEEN